MPVRARAGNSSDDDKKFPPVFAYSERTSRQKGSKIFRPNYDWEIDKFNDTRPARLEAEKFVSSVDHSIAHYANNWEYTVKSEVHDTTANGIAGTPGLADALESDRFKQFLDHVPVAIAVSELLPSEFITYANVEFERLTGVAVAEICGQRWSALPGIAARHNDETALSEAVEAREKYISGASPSTAMTRQSPSTPGQTRLKMMRACHSFDLLRWPRRNLRSGTPTVRST